VLSAGVLGAAGMAILPGTPPHASGRARTFVDALIVAASALFVGGTLGLGDLYRVSSTPHPGLMVAVGIGYVALASGVIVIATRARPSARGALLSAAAACSALAVGTVGLAYLALGGSAAIIALLLAGWPLGWLLIVHGARRVLDGSRPDDLEPGLPTRASVFVPSLPFAVALAAGAGAAVRGDFTPFLIWNGTAIVILIVARQVLALVENISFWRRLQRKVEARTEEVRRSEARFRSLVQHSSDVITVIGGDATVRYQSPSTQAVLGHSPCKPGDQAPANVVHPNDLPHIRAVATELAKTPGATASVECRLRHRDGGWRYVEAIASNRLGDPGVEGFVINARDITERKQLEEQLTHRAFHDPLTNLANRALFADRLEHALKRATRSDGLLAVLFLDLDQFKNVNDTLGHGTGDELLTTVAHRVESCLRPGDTVARLGGDEFAVLIEQVENPLEAARVAELVLKALEPPVSVAGKEIRIRGSIGIATSDAVGAGAEELLSAADVAMYTAKGKGKGGYEFFEPSMHRSLVERLELEENLHEAIAREEFALDYQPLVSLKTRSVRGVEALVRWEHPARGLLGPHHFIALAEDTGLMVPIGRWVLQTACRQAQEWQTLFPDAPSRMTVVNLSPTQLKDPNLVRDVEAALDDSALDPRSLVLEITESAVVESASAIEKLQRLRDLGVRLSVDDFGTGYSSLSYLRRLPVDIVKIDRVFLEDMARGSQQAAIVEAMITLCRSLGITPVAEGVERPEQAEELERLGCSLAQGFYFERPVPPKRIVQLLASGDALQQRQGRRRQASRS
jgi:diguanylate cyclase (GGDEF)-like protein/PAS domain S-box-containing protein